MVRSDWRSKKVRSGCSANSGGWDQKGRNSSEMQLEGVWCFLPLSFVLNGCPVDLNGGRGWRCESEKG